MSHPALRRAPTAVRRLTTATSAPTSPANSPANSLPGQTPPRPRHPTSPRLHRRILFPRPPPRTRPTPPPIHLLPLLAALTPLALPATPTNKLDLSFHDPLSPWSQTQQQGQNTHQRPPPLTPKSIAAQFLRHFCYERGVPRALGGMLPGEEAYTDVGRVFGPEVRDYLERRGWRVEDVMVWVWVLVARDVETSVRRLEAWAESERAVKVKEREEKERVAGRVVVVGEWRKRVEEWRRREEEEEEEGWGWGLGMFREVEGGGEVEKPTEAPIALPQQTPIWSWRRVLGLFRRKAEEPGRVTSAEELMSTPVEKTKPTDDTTPGQTAPADAASSPNPAEGNPGNGNTPTEPTLYIPHAPSFLLLHLLRSPHLSPITLRRLLPFIMTTLTTTPSGDTKTPLLLLLRLLRHTRRTYPSAIPHTATLLTTYIHPLTSPPTPSARLTATYNRLLSLFSYPPSRAPYASLPLLQRSQFLLLRKMAALNIPITREGYRAITTIQLAHRKTAAEARRTASMSPSWPPWPAPRDGHPGSTETATMLSRAAQVLRQMTEAGYAARGWEKEAGVLAGVDTDGTPTVQTRTLFFRRRGSGREVETGVWGVRVRATRTVEEAWNVFCAGMESGGVGDEVWVEMFEKVVAARKVRRAREERERKLEMVRAAWVSRGGGERERERLEKWLAKWDMEQRGEEERAKRVLGGDAKEVWAVRNPGEGVWVGSPVPSTEELFMMMKRVGKKAGKKLVAMLVKDADSIQAGDWVVKQWSKERWRRMVKGTAPPDSLEMGQSGFRPYKARHYHADPHILTSYLHLLLTHSRKPTPSTPDHTDYAIRLLLGHAPPYTPAWNTTLAGLTYSLFNPSLSHTTKCRRARIVWTLYKDLINLTTHDMETLRLLCVSAHRAQILASIRSTDAILWDGRKPIDQVIRIFSTTLEIDHTPTTLPELMILEAPAIHAYVRLLGFAGRNAEIVGVLRLLWGRGVAVDTVMWRRVVVAARVFLEDDGECKGEARRVVEGWLGGEAWASGREVEEYCVRGGMY